MEHTLISKVESLEKQTALHKLQIDELTRKMLANKRVMNMEEACLYSGISKSTLYKLTCKGEIPTTSHRGNSSSSSATSSMPGCSATG